MDYKQLCFQVQDLMRETGKFILIERDKISNSDVSFKSVSSLVTYVDKTAEETLVAGLKKLFPNSGFVAEEGTATYDNEKFLWFIDPLDGTTNYVHGITPFSISVALAENNELALGVVYEISSAEMFYAWKGSPAFSNGKEIKVSTTRNSADALIGTGIPYYNFDESENYIGAFRELMVSTRGIRRLGSAAVDLCYVASGRFDAFFEHALHAWDVAAGVFILKQAGGVASDFNGGENWLFGGEMVATNKNYYPEFYGIVNRFLGKK
jgi:myo-inositol-1(or 4)-monophosphatase